MLKSAVASNTIWAWSGAAKTAAASITQEPSRRSMFPRPAKPRCRVNGRSSANEDELPSKPEALGFPIRGCVFIGHSLKGLCLRSCGGTYPRQPSPQPPVLTARPSTETNRTRCEHRMFIISEVDDCLSGRFKPGLCTRGVSLTFLSIFNLQPSALPT